MVVVAEAADRVLFWVERESILSAEMAVGGL